jgi:hypothetical protein
MLATYLSSGPSGVEKRRFTSEVEREEWADDLPFGIERLVRYELSGEGTQARLALCAKFMREHKIFSMDLLSTWEGRDELKTEYGEKIYLIYRIVEGENDIDVVLQYPDEEKVVGTLTMRVFDNGARVF